MKRNVSTMFLLITTGYYCDANTTGPLQTVDCIYTLTYVSEYSTPYTQVVRSTYRQAVRCKVKLYLSSCTV